MNAALNPFRCLALEPILVGNISVFEIGACGFTDSGDYNSAFGIVCVSFCGPRQPHDLHKKEVQAVFRSRTPWSAKASVPFGGRTKTGGAENRAASVTHFRVGFAQFSSTVRALRAGRSCTGIANFVCSISHFLLLRPVPACGLVDDLDRA